MEKDEYGDAAMQTNLTGAIGQGAAQQAAAQFYMQEQEKGLSDTQLDVDSIKSEIYHLLKQDKFIEKDGKFAWIPITSENERTFTDRGVDKLMQIIHFYINKNNLLSNFDEPTIKRIMNKFIKEVNDLILLEYEIIFREPTFEQCKEIIQKKIDDKIKIRMFSLEILGKKGDEQEIKSVLLNEIERTLEREIHNIRKDQRKQKIKDYGITIAQLEIIVLATLNRAYRGEERGSLRRHMTVSELIGGNSKGFSNESKGGIFKWGRN